MTKTFFFFGNLDLKNAMENQSNYNYLPEPGIRVKCNPAFAMTSLFP